MEWHKVEDYPVGSGEYVLVSAGCPYPRTPQNCITAKMTKDGYWDDGTHKDIDVDPADKWCYIDLPED